MPESTVVRELVTFLGFDIDDKALAEFDKKVNSIRKNLKRMAITGGIVAGALTAIVVRTTRLGNNIAKTSKRLGLGVEKLQEYRFAFDQAEVSAQTFDMAVQRAGRRLAEAAKGTGEAVKAVAELGIQLTDTNGDLRDLDDLLMDAFDALSAVENQTDRNRLAMKLFDSEGVRLVQGLDKGNKALRANMKLFAETGAVIDEKTAKAAEELADQWGILLASLNGLIITIGKELLPLATDLIKAIRKWIVTNRAAIVTVGALGFAILTVTAIMFGAIAMTTLWNLKLVILNKTVGALIIKLLLIPLAIATALAALGILAQDFIIGIGQSGDSVTGRILNAISALGERLKKGALGYLGAVWNRMKEIWTWLKDLPAEFFAGLQRLYARLPAPVKAALELGASAASAGAGAVSDLGRDLTPSEQGQLARAFGGGGVPVAPTQTSNQFSFTINALPGQDAVAIGNEVSRKLTGVGITGGLTGLGK